MARKVRVLPDEIANRIAAGEVVERPASVVKELVENAVDAGAGRISVSVRRAGVASVEVADDGHGMGREDALLSLERHATSKIGGIEDLERIATLGFRGEALPSIASVSRFRMTTRREEDTEGTRLRVEGGRLLAVDSVGAPRGTTIEVTDLFFNMPARRKFLKSDATELRHVVDTVSQMALVHPAVAFELRSEGRLLLAVPESQALEERAAELVGAEAAGGLHPVQIEEEDRSFVIACAAPHESRGHRRDVRFFVNGRPVQDRVLFRAVMEGYRGLLEKDRFPVVLLWLRVPPDEVDVNVHPAKREVRFRDEGRVFRWVASSTAAALERAPWATGDRMEGTVAPAREAAPVPDASAPYVGRVAEALQRYGRESERRTGERLFPSRRSAPGASRPDARARATGEHPPDLRAPLRSGLPFEQRGCIFSELRFLGAFDATYLLFEDQASRELVILDQHAAHERILYEELLRRAGEAGGPSRQALLVPVVLECTPAELAVLDERCAALSALGFRIEAFGAGSVAVQEVPAGFPSGAVGETVRDILTQEDSEEAEEKRLESLARRAACSAAVKARSPLVGSEVRALLDRLETLRHPTHCPHGRPLLLRLGRRRLEEMFHRA